MHPARKKGGETIRVEGCMFEKDKRTGGHSDAPQSCEHRGPLPELYECEPLSVRVEAVRLMKH